MLSMQLSSADLKKWHFLYFMCCILEGMGKGF